MTQIQNTQLTLAQLLWPAHTHSWMRSVVLMAVGSLLLAASAKIYVPLLPVPVTMQTMMVVLVGMAYGTTLGTATVLLYLAEGVAGLPVFAEGKSGFAALLGPTGGYLVGFVFAAAVCGWLAERRWGRNFIFAALAMLIGNVVLYIFGLLWLGTVVGWDKPVLAIGLIPFIPGDILKLLMAAVALPATVNLVRRSHARRKR